MTLDPLAWLVTLAILALIVAGTLGAIAVLWIAYERWTA